ncbi:MAG: response regulator [Desulfobacter sp.]|nr:MAG: response regulator [Desulfobacter sp.]
MGNNVLIVDDEPRFAASLKCLLEKKGIAARVSLSVADALLMFRENPVKVVISDIQMPRQNGFDLMTDVIGEDSLTQFIFLTGYPSIDYIKQAFRRNAFEFFKKPIEDVNVLAGAVAEARINYDRLRQDRYTQQKLQNEAAVFGHILDGIDTGVLVLDMSSCRVIFANRRFNLEMGHPEDLNLSGRKCLEVIPGRKKDPCRVCTNSRILDHLGRPAGSFEWEMENPVTGSRYTVMDKAIQWIDGRIVRLSTFFNITEKRKHEIMFRAYEKKVRRLAELENIETLAGGIAHQFNNSLSVISGNLELMELEMARHEKKIPYTRAMKASAEKMVDMTASLLAYARGGKYRVRELRFHEMVNRALHQLSHDIPDHVQINKQVPEAGLRVRVDMGQIRTLLGNIIENAVEAGAGRIDISGSGKPSPPPRLNGTDRGKTGHGAYLCLEIRDNGQGMDSDTLERVFQPFFTTKFQGRGLGLAASMGIVKGHQGFIFMESEPGRGTRVSVHLPVWAGEIPAIKPEQKGFRFQHS